MSRSTSRSNYRESENGGSREGTANRGGLRKMISDGIRVTAEMPDPRMARITIDIDWQHLVSRVAREVGRKIKHKGQARRSTATRRTTRSPSSSR